MLVSARGLQTRPMMEKVRAAVFSMIHAQLGGVSRLPAESRWLDLFAGMRGSVCLFVCLCGHVDICVYVCMHVCV